MLLERNSMQFRTHFLQNFKTLESVFNILKEIRIYVLANNNLSMKLPLINQKDRPNVFVESC